MHKAQPKADLNIRLFPIAFDLTAKIIHCRDKDIPERGIFNLNLVKQISRSQAFIALFIVAIVNGILLVANPLGTCAPEQLPSAHSWIWWTTKDFLAQSPPPSVVLLGSSLLLNPIQEEEADYLNKDVDTVTTHYSLYLKSRLSNYNLNNWRCFNFAVPGSLVSDNYMVLRSLINRRKPKLIVLALALRDFIDNEVPCAAATPTYKYLSRFTDTSDLTELTMPNIWQRFEYLLNNHIYLLGKKLDLQSSASQAASSAYELDWNKQCSNCLLNAFDMSCYIPGFRSEVERGVWIARPHQNQAFQDNSSEYKRRYRSSNKNLFQCQKLFLLKFCQLARASKIPVVIVNMPVTAQHLKLMPNNAYANYIETLRLVSAQYSTPLLDLNSLHEFKDEDFADSCHMRASGGKKLLNLLGAAIVADPRVVCFGRSYSQ